MKIKMILRSIGLMFLIIVGIICLWAAFNSEDISFKIDMGISAILFAVIFFGILNLFQNEK